MSTFKVKSAIKKNGTTYQPGEEIELSAKEAKELSDALVIDAEKTPELAPRTPTTKAEKEAAKQAKKIEAAKEKANAEVDAELAERKNENGDADLKEPTVVNRRVTKEDMDLDPTLVGQGVKIGDMRDFTVVETEDDADDL